jgi:hypothetical protein
MAEHLPALMDHQVVILFLEQLQPLVVAMEAQAQPQEVLGVLEVLLGVLRHRVKAIMEEAQLLVVMVAQEAVAQEVLELHQLQLYPLVVVEVLGLFHQLQDHRFNMLVVGAEQDIMYLMVLLVVAMVGLQEIHLEQQV